VLTLLTLTAIVLGMTQMLIVLEALALIALYWGGPIAALALAAWAWKRSQRRYHVGNPHSVLPAQTFRTRGAAVRASMEAYRQTGRAHRIVSTR
jgi:hypothetical protein